MTRSALIVISIVISLTSGQSPRDLLVSRCPCMNRRQCIIRLGDDDFDDDELFRSVPVCPLGSVPCCSRFEMRVILREAFSGAPPPLVNTGRDLIPGPSAGPTAGEIDQLGRLLDAQAPAPSVLGRQQPDFNALLAGLDAPGAVDVGGLSEADALAGLESLAGGSPGAALGGIDSLAGALPGVGAGDQALDALAGLDSLAASFGVGQPGAPASLPAPAPAPLPVPTFDSVQASAPLPAVSLPQQAPGPAAPSVKIVGPQPIYISSDKVIGPSVNGAGRPLHPGVVEEGRQSQPTGDQLSILRALRALF